MIMIHEMWNFKHWLHKNHPQCSTGVRHAVHADIFHSIMMRHGELNTGCEYHLQPRIMLNMAHG